MGQSGIKRNSLCYAPYSTTSSTVSFSSQRGFGGLILVIRWALENPFGCFCKKTPRLLSWLLIILGAKKVPKLLVEIFQAAHHPNLHEKKKIQEVVISRRKQSRKSSKYRHTIRLLKKAFYSLKRSGTL